MDTDQCGQKRERELISFPRWAEVLARAEALRAPQREAYRRAIGLLEADLALTPRDPDVLTSLALALAFTGRSDAARQKADEALALEPEAPDVLRSAALVYLAAGERERALGYLESAVAHGYSVAELRHDPELLRLKGDARFARLTGTRPG